MWPEAVRALDQVGYGDELRQSRSADAGADPPRDVVGAVAAGAEMSAATAGDHASRDIHVCAPGDESTEVAHRMPAAGMRHMPVIQDGQLIGMVSMRDLLAVEVWA